jgi:hypothetical protein
MVPEEPPNENSNIQSFGEDSIKIVPQKKFSGE